MHDQRLIRTMVTVQYRSDDGYIREATYRGTQERPDLGLLEALEELARIAALYGFEAQALEAFHGSLQRAADWRAQRQSACIGPQQQRKEETP